ncbi:MAG: Ig-like domain-containing protein [Gemmatimonadaceae bacterium]
MPAVLVLKAMRIPTRFLRASAECLVAVALLASCGDSTKAPALITLEISPASGSVQVGATLALTVQAKDGSGAVITGQSVTFTSSDESKATVTSGGVVTGVALGSVTITAASDGKSAQAVLAVIAGPPARLVKTSGDAQTGIVGSALGQPLVAKVTDVGGNPVSGAIITWTLTGGGILGAASATTDATGTAQTTLTLGSTPGTSSVTAAVTGVSPSVTFSETSAWSTVRDDWPTYGHDAARTSASAQASMPGALRVVWRYQPAGVAGHALLNVTNALATGDGVFLQMALASGYGYGLSPAVDKVSLAGAKVWTYNMGTDADFGNWGAVWGNRFVMNDDGIRYVDITSGSATVNLGVDSWGETLSDASGLYLANDVQIDGPGVYVGSLNATGGSIWKQNSFATCRGSASNTAGGLALANGTVFFAPDYHPGKTTTTLPFSSGVFAFSAAAGAAAGSAATTPYSRISADAQRVYLVENNNTLVARAQSDLRVIWSKTVSGPGEQAPVIANGLVIIGTSSRVEAYDAATGSARWTSGALSGADAHWGATTQGGSCGTTPIPEGTYYSTTTLAAALPSNTLVVAAQDGLHLLSLATGAEIWKGTVSGASGRVRNPVLVNDPVQGPILYVVDYNAVYALKP